MSETQNFGFGKFVPGFDFLQNLAKSATPQMPNLASWIAPTLSVEELERRVTDLKAVHFWLEQNAAALSATIQALEVQKMTLATLKGMNVSMEQMADAFRFKMPDVGAAGVETREPPAKAPASSRPAAKKATARPASPSGRPDGDESGNGAAKGIVDPMQWWGSLTQQFQQIAANALKDASQAPIEMAAGVAREAAKTAETVAKAAAPRARKAPARRTGRKTAR